MISELCARGVLSVEESDGCLLGYRFSSELYEAYEVLDAALLRVLPGEQPMTRHSCATLIDRAVLNRIGFFDKLPSIPFEVTPHGTPLRTSGAWILSPSTCYNTFLQLSGDPGGAPPRLLTARGRCHRHEPGDASAMRMSAFDMRELVLIGTAEEVVERAEEMLGRAETLIGALHPGIRVERASDIFYGERSRATRKVQYALGVKREIILPWPDGSAVAVGSRNLHRELFTEAFRIGLRPGSPPLHSACVAFGLERLLLSLLAVVPDHDPAVLIERLSAASRLAPAGEPA